MGKAIGIVMLLAVILGSHPASATPASVAEVLAALDQGDALHAARLADLALADAGESAGERNSLLVYRGLARELLGARDDAMRDFTQALNGHALPPDEREQALLQRGFLRDGLGRLDEAAQDYTAAIALQGAGLAAALNNRANIYRRQNKLLQARLDYLAALSAGNGRQQYSYFGLGQIAEAEKDIAAARGFYAKAVLADPGYAPASQRLAALPDSAISDSGERIVLRPPQARTVTEAKPASAQGRDHGRDLSSPQRSWPVRDSAPPRFQAVNALTLRPALDQTDASVPNLTGSSLVQLGAWRSMAEAEAGWTKARTQARGALDRLTPHIFPADLPGKGRYYRLRVSVAADQGRAGLCAMLTARGLACLPVSN